MTTIKFPKMFSSASTQTVQGKDAALENIKLLLSTEKK